MSLNQNVQLADEVEHPLEWVSMEEDFFGKTVSTPVQRMCDKLETLAQVAHAACGVPSNDLGMEESFDLMEELGLFNTFMSDTLPVTTNYHFKSFKCFQCLGFLFLSSYFVGLGNNRSGCCCKCG